MLSSMPDISSYIVHLSYLGIFLWFLIIEQLTPIPEEVSLMSVGYISIHANLNPLLSGIAALIGLLITDNVLFYLSAKGSKFSQKLLGKINHQLLEKIKRNLKKRSGITIFVGALLPKLRFFNPIIIGTMNITFKQFFLINGAATLLYVSVYMSIGIFFHQQLNIVLKELKLVQHAIFIFVMVLIFYIFFT